MLFYQNFELIKWECCVMYRWSKAIFNHNQQLLFWIHNSIQRRCIWDSQKETIPCRDIPHCVTKLALSYSNTYLFSVRLHNGFVTLNFCRQLLHPNHPNRNCKPCPIGNSYKPQQCHYSNVYFESTLLPRPWCDCIDLSSDCACIPKHCVLTPYKIHLPTGYHQRSEQDVLYWLWFHNNCKTT